jgi:hypothetical protein
MIVLGRFDVLPLQAQIDIRDPAGAEYPQWETGEERAVATDQCVAVATRSDADGRVTVEVRLGGPQEPMPDRAIAFDGEVLVTGEALVVGNLLAGEEHALPLARGWHRLIVTTHPTDGPAEDVVLTIDPDVREPGE